MSLGTTNLLASGPGNSVGGGVVFSGKRQLCFGVGDPKQLSIQIKNEKAIMSRSVREARVGRNREKNSKSALATILVLVEFGLKSSLVHETCYTSFVSQINFNIPGERALFVTHKGLEYSHCVCMTGSSALKVIHWLIRLLRCSGQESQVNLSENL